MKSRFERVTILAFAVLMPLLALSLFAQNGSLVAKAGGGPVTPPIVLPVTPPTNSNNNSSSNNNNSSSNSSSSSSSSSNTSSHVCGDARPQGKMELFQINRNGTTAQLFFTPNALASGYHVTFGLKVGDERYGGISMIPTTSQGVQSIKISHLTAGKAYAFKVMPVNGCATGESSNWLLSSGKGSKYSNFLYTKKSK